MKIIKYLKASIIVAVIFVLGSCNDTFELHEKYIKDGEIVYSNKVEELTTLPGKNRIKIKGSISNAFNAIAIVVYWNNGKNSQEFPYTKSKNKTDELELIIDNLEEKSYSFEVYSKDKDGNLSVKSITFGTVYGNNFRSILEPREVDKIVYNSGINMANVFFKVRDDLTRNTELKYTNLNNDEVEKIIANDVSTVELEGVDITKPIQYKTFYAPTRADTNSEETSIDLFDSDMATVVAPTHLKPILESVTFESAFGGVKVHWENPEKVELNLNFKNPSSIGLTSSLTTSEMAGEKLIIPVKAGEENIEIAAVDVYGNSWINVYTATTTPVVPLDKSGWQVVDFSSEALDRNGWSYPAANIIDGDNSSWWATVWWGDPLPPFPHHVTFDMGSEKQISYFVLHPTIGDWDWTAVEYEVQTSSDNVNWTEAANISVKEQNRVIFPDPGTTGRYVKFIVVEANRDWANLAEIDVFGLEN